MQIVGHRGWPSAAHGENTLVAIDAALRSGADGVEVDVRLTRDGTAVCCHDQDLSRVAGSPAAIAELDWTELRDVVLLSGQHIPTLRQVVRLVAGRGLLVLDLKLDHRAAELAEVTLAQATRLPTADLVVSSFHDEVLDATAVLRPDLPRARLVDTDESTLEALASAVARGDGAMHLPIRTVLTDPAAVRAVLETGRLVRAWTVNRPVDARLCQALGVSAVITDVPAQFVALQAAEQLTG